MKRLTFLFSCTMILAICLGADSPSPDVLEPPPQDDFLVIPLRVHILQADDLPEVDCALTDADIERIRGKVNGIWNKAGIHFGLESLVREPAANRGKYRASRDLRDEKLPPAELFRILRPEESQKFDGLHVYYVHQFSVNGIYMGSDFSFVKETAKLREVEGGIDEPLPRVTSHELGHALGLPHRQDRTNLLASGTTGTILNRDEVEKARDRAREIQGTRQFTNLANDAEAAEKKDDRPLAERLRSWKSEVESRKLTAGSSKNEPASDKDKAPQ